MGYEPFKMEPDTWLRDCGEHYDHIDVYVDDLLIASKDGQNAVDDITNKNHLMLKGTGPMPYHLGHNFGRDGDRILHFAPRKHIEKMEEC